MNISQSGFVMGALIAGFVLWLALNQRLGTYWNILIGGAGSSAGGAAGGSGTTWIIPPMPSLGFPGMGIN